MSSFLGFLLSRIRFDTSPNDQEYPRDFEIVDVSKDGLTVTCRVKTTIPWKEFEETSGGEQTDE
jgi:hypothetical protein